MGNRTKIMIFVDFENSVGLRQVIHIDDLPDIYKVLRSKDLTIDKWIGNKRHKEYLLAFFNCQNILTKLGR